MSTTLESNRRLFRRFDVGLDVIVDVDGSKMNGTVYDISLGGVSFAPGNTEWLDKTVAILDGELGQGLRLEGRVVGVRDDRTHLRFELDEQTEENLAFFLIASENTRF